MSKTKAATAIVRPERRMKRVASGHLTRHPHVTWPCFLTCWAVCCYRCRAHGTSLNHGARWPDEMGDSRLWADQDRKRIHFLALSARRQSSIILDRGRQSNSKDQIGGYGPCQVPDREKNSIFNFKMAANSRLLVRSTG